MSATASPAPRFKRPKVGQVGNRGHVFYDAPKDLLERINLRLLYSEEGRLVKVLCPAHKDGHEPNLAIYPRNAYCHACGFHEGAFEHIERVCETHNWAEVLAVAARLTGTARRTGAGPLPPKAPTMAQIEDYVAQLDGWTDGRAYIMSRYGLTPSTQRRALLGYSRSARAYTIPVLDFHARPVNIKFRSAAQNPDLKFWGMEGCNAVRWYYPPYALDPAAGPLLDKRVEDYSGHRAVVVCEGELDSLALYQMGIPSLSCTGGANALASDDIEGVRHLLDELRDVQVLLAYDQDQAGRRAAVSVASNMERAGLSVRILEWDPRVGKDPSELLSQGWSADVFRRSAFQRSVESSLANWTSRGIIN